VRGRKSLISKRKAVVAVLIIICLSVATIASIWWYFRELTSKPSGSTTVVVDAANIIKTIDKRVYGAHTAAWHEMVLNKGVIRPIAVQRVQEMGLKYLNYPGGGYGNEFVWNDMNLPTEMNTDQFIEFCQLVGATPRIVVNVNKPAQLAADWVNYTNVQKGYNVTYWVLHDEPYYYMNAATYADKVNEFAAAMKAVDPTIKIGACVSCSYSSVQQFTETVVQNAGQNIDFYNHNAFFIEPNEYGYAQRQAYYDELLYETSGRLKTWLATLRGIVEEYFPTKSVEYHVGSFNSISWGPADWTLNFLPEGLWVADMLGTLITEPVTFGGIWCLMNPYPPKQGDYGILSPEFEPYVSYYPYVLYSNHFGDMLVSSTSALTDISVYASISSGGSKLHIMLINKNPTTDHAITFTLQNFNPQSTATAWILDGPTEPAHVYDYSLRTENITGVSTTFTWTVPSYSAVAIEIAKAGVTAEAGLATVKSTSVGNTYESAGVQTASENLALGKPANASSSALKEQCKYYHIEDFNASKAVDGDGTWTRWASRIWDPHSEWFQLDLQAVTTFSRIVLKWEYWSTSYDIEISDDAQTWSRVATQANATVIKSEPQPVHQFDFGTSLNARFIKLTMTSRPSKYGISAGCSTWTPQAFSLWEFEVYNIA